MGLVVPSNLLKTLDCINNINLGGENVCVKIELKKSKICYVNGVKLFIRIRK